MDGLTVTQLQTPPLTLGEGPVWIAETQTLYFVDIRGCALHAFQEGRGIVRTLQTPGLAGFITPWGKRLLLAAGGALYAVEPDTGDITLHMALHLNEGLRINDGKCDPEGRLWVGVMADDRTAPGARLAGMLLGIWQGEVLQTLAPMDIPNGLAWNGNVFYHADSTAHRIDAYTRHADGTVGQRRTAVEIGDGVPDGFCIDAEGMLWVAQWGAGCVQRYDPATGRALAQRVSLPRTHTSSCCFGGPDLRTLYITAAQGPDGAGGLYACRTDVQGVLPYAYGG